MIDLFGQALYDYYKGLQIAPLLLHTKFSSPDELDMDGFFFDENQFTLLEKYALDLCHGSVLDIGAAAGRHCLHLQSSGIDVTGLDGSGNCIRVMMDRGVRKVIHQDIFDLSGKQYNTLLMLMNGIGLVSTLQGLRNFLVHIKKIIQKDGQLILDSSNVSYLREEYDYFPEKYIGEIDYYFEYKGICSHWFTWLYIDMDNLIKMAAEEGWATQIIYENQYDEYLARLTLI